MAAPRVFDRERESHPHKRPSAGRSPARSHASFARRAPLCAATTPPVPPARPPMRAVAAWGVCCRPPAVGAARPSGSAPRSSGARPAPPAAAARRPPAPPPSRSTPVPTPSPPARTARVRRAPPPPARPGQRRELRARRGAGHRPPDQHVAQPPRRQPAPRRQFGHGHRAQQGEHAPPPYPCVVRIPFQYVGVVTALELRRRVVEPVRLLPHHKGAPGPHRPPPQEPHCPPARTERRPGPRSCARGGRSRRSRCRDRSPDCRLTGRVARRASSSRSASATGAGRGGGGDGPEPRRVRPCRGRAERAQRCGHDEVEWLQAIRVRRSTLRHRRQQRG